MDLASTPCPTQCLRGAIQPTRSPTPGQPGRVRARVGPCPAKHESARRGLRRTNRVPLRSRTGSASSRHPGQQRPASPHSTLSRTACRTEPSWLRVESQLQQTDSRHASPTGSMPTRARTDAQPSAVSVGHTIDGLPDCLPDYAQKAGAPSDSARPTQRPTDVVSHGVDKPRQPARLTRRRSESARSLTLDPTNTQSSPVSSKVRPLAENH